eukprot:204630-Prorocentrum_minimum.AAC.1
MSSERSLNGSKEAEASPQCVHWICDCSHPPKQRCVNALSSAGGPIWGSCFDMIFTSSCVSMRIMARRNSCASSCG